MLISLCVWLTDGKAASGVVQKKNIASAKTIPESLGFSKAGLKRIDDFFRREIAAKRVPGAVVGIMRDGKLVYLSAFGSQYLSTGQAMRSDTIFAIAPMTKPMVAVGALALTQEGKPPLFSRLDQYIPALAAMKVEHLGQEGKSNLFNKTNLYAYKT